MTFDIRHFTQLQKYIYRLHAIGKMLSSKLLRSGVIKPFWITTLFRSTGLEPQAETSSDLLETREITKDRTEQIPVETSIKYLKSAAFKKTYEDQPVWVLYRRNFKGLYPPRKTRKTCIRQGKISTGNPCPICRDEYLVLHEENTELLKQFISPYTGAILSYNKTGLCQKQHQQLEICIKRAYDRGLITFDVPFRKYNYSEYYKEEK